MNTSMPGQEGIPSVFSPMARTREDLVYFSRSLIGMKPWKWDHTVHPIEWRIDEERKVKEQTGFKIGVMRTDGAKIWINVRVLTMLTVQRRSRPVAGLRSRSRTYNLRPTLPRS